MLNSWLPTTERRHRRHLLIANVNKTVKISLTSKYYSGAGVLVFQLSIPYMECHINSPVVQGLLDKILQKAQIKERSCSVAKVTLAEATVGNVDI